MLPYTLSPYNYAHDSLIVVFYYNSMSVNLHCLKVILLVLGQAYGYLSASGETLKDNDE